MIVSSILTGFKRISSSGIPAIFSESYNLNDLYSWASFKPVMLHSKSSWACSPSKVTASFNIHYTSMGIVYIVPSPKIKNNLSNISYPSIKFSVVKP